MQSIYTDQPAGTHIEAAWMTAVHLQILVCSSIKEVSVNINSDKKSLAKHSFADIAENWSHIHF